MWILKRRGTSSRCLFKWMKMTGQCRTRYAVLFTLFFAVTVFLYSLGAVANRISDVHVYIQKSVDCETDGYLQLKLLKHVGFKTRLSDDPEVCMNVTQLITSKGYPCEEHRVTTEDGYILGVQRIPHGKKKQSVVSGRPVVFLQHGLLASATNWVTNLANESFGFVLADAGFDVWLGNSRGNTYSRNHVKLSPKEDAFWAWSWDEMAKYDIPAVIDYVLQKTGERQLYFIGHSQGTLQAFAAFSQNATLAKKVKQFFAMGPVATIAHIESPIKYMAIFTDELLYGLLGRRDFLPSDWIFKVLGSTICKEKITSIICTNVIFLLAGYDTSNLNVTRLPVYVSHAPAGTSMQDMVHFAQMSRSGRFQAYDWGTPEKNKIHYHQATPPLYNVSTMATPTVLYWADHDWLADPKDVAALQQKITNLKGSYELKSWNHLDFIWGVDAATLVYKPIINLIKKDLKS
ncbi:gastric triacylglycerol lipase-like isoform X1 [Saccostrea echinata]|uniref:gastric triacylglycerol lipase-like isoform X1 n=1 Tax=Saccostrea echinata TaxID=191078 RepID=UPI002A80F4E3|nr:gastric triacylglycerol lipase-like isoform X1 [Saccostrea echinata]